MQIDYDDPTVDVLAWAERARGDVGILQFVGSGSIVAPTGWTLLTSAANPLTGEVRLVWFRVIDGSEPDASAAVWDAKAQQVKPAMIGVLRFAPVPL